MSEARTLLSRGKGLLLVRLLPAVALLVVMVLLSRRLPQAVYGDYQNVWVRYALLSSLSCLGVPAIAQVVGPDVLAGALRRFGRKQVALLAGWLLLTALLFLWWNRSILPVMLAGSLFAVWSLAVVAEGLLLGMRRFRETSWINAGYAVVFVVLHFFWKGASVAPIFLFLLLPATARLLLFVYFLRKTVLVMRLPLNKAVRPADKKLWVQLALYDALQQGMRSLDKTLVGFLVTPALSAVYFNGAQEVPFLPLLLGAVGGAFLHSAADNAGASPAHKAHLLRTAGGVMSALLFPLFWALLLCRQPLFAVVFSAKYEASAAIFAMILVVLPFRAYPFSALLHHYRAGGLVNAGVLGDMIVAPLLALLLFPSMGLPGVALAFSLSTILMVTFYTIATLRITKLRVSDLFPLRTWGLQMAVSAGGVGGIYMLTQQLLLSPLQLLLTVCAGAGILAIVLYKKALPPVIPKSGS
jgi:O-antigen/teichoic acid export membrane protein